MTEPKELTYEAEVIEDARTGEIIPKGANEIPLPTEQKTIINVHQIGVLDISQEAIDIITAPLDAGDVQIRPDGQVYLPWTWRAKRLNNAFGIFKWGMIPQGAPLSKTVDENNVLVVWGWWLVVKGVPVAFSYGETSYRPKNKSMSYGDACEGAKSNALSRNCKQIGMPDIELYSVDWVKEWKAKYAERVKNPDGGYPEYIWRKKAKNSNGHQPEQKATEPAKQEVKAAPEVVYENLVSWAELKKIPMIEQLALDSGKKKSEVAIFIGKLDHAGSYSIEQVVKELKGA